MCINCNFILSFITTIYCTFPANYLTRRPFSLPPQIYYYADSIYATAGVKENDIQYVTVGTGAVNVFMTIAAVGIPWTKWTFEGRSWNLPSGVWSHQQEATVLNSKFVFTRSSSWRPQGDGCSSSAVSGSAVQPVWCSLSLSTSRYHVKASLWLPPSTPYSAALKWLSFYSQLFQSFSTLRSGDLLWRLSHTGFQDRFIICLFIF